MTWEFHVGQRVVCVDGRRRNILPPKAGWVVEDHPDGTWLRTSAIYTIRSIYHCPLNNVLCLRLVGFYRPNWPEAIKAGDVDDVGFFAGRFRPLVTRKTDISIFTAMLVPQKASEPA